MLDYRIVHEPRRVLLAETLDQHRAMDSQSNENDQGRDRGVVLNPVFFVQRCAFRLAGYGAIPSILFSSLPKLSLRQ